ncbi:MAG: hypothetical protein ABI886_02855 [Betaproteobacteria bacterium]
MKNNLAAVLLAAAVLAVPSAWAQGTAVANAGDVTDMPALLAAVKADKKGYVASVLNLTPAEAKKFWPVYDAYQRDLDMANRQRTRALQTLIARDKPPSDLLAKSLANDLIGADDTELRGRRTLHNRLIKPLPGRTIMPPAKGARYLQLETKIRTAQAYAIVATIPLVN